MAKSLKKKQPLEENPKAGKKSVPPEKTYSFLFEQNPAGIYQTAPLGKILACNNAFVKMLGYSSQKELLGKNANSFYFSGKDRDGVLDHLQKKGKLNSREIKLRHKSGKPVYLIDNCSLRKDALTGEDVIDGIVIDITERKKAEEALMKAKISLNEAQRIAKIGSWEADLKTGKVLWSDEMYRIYECGPGTFTPTLKTPVTLIHPEDRQAMKNLVVSSLSGIKQAPLDYRLITADGSIKFVRGEGEVILNKAGKPVRAVGTVQDITEQKKAETHIKNISLQLEKIFNTLNDSLWGNDIANHKMLYVSPGNQKVFGYPDEMFLNNPDFWLEVILPEDRHKVDALYPIIGQGKFASTEFRIRHADSSIRWVEVRMTPTMDAEGKLIRLDGITIDITERKKAEVLFSESQQRYKSLLDNMNEGFIVDDTAGKVLFANKEFLNIYGLSENDLSNIVLEDYVAPEYREMLRDRHNRRIAGEQVPDVFEYEGLRKDGKRIWLGVRVNPIINNGIIQGTQSVISDITKRKKAEEALLKERNLSDSIINSLPNLFFLFDEKGKFLRWNKNLEAVTGYSAEEISQRSPIDFFDDDEKQLLVEKITEGFIQGAADVEAHLFTKAKEKILYYFNGWQVIYEGKPCMIDVGIDITERKKAEIKLNETLLALQTSNNELEQFAYVVSHDLQEPLRMVSSFVNLLDKKLEGQLDETAKQYIHFAVDGAARMKTLIQDLLQYSRVGTNKEDFSSTDLNEVLNYITLVLEETIKKNRAVVTVHPLPVVTVNKTLITQLFANLVSNALKFHGGKEPEIEVGYTEEQDNYIFYVKDNGIGIEPKNFERIFIVFQRLHSKNEYPGIGIGLAICKKIAEIHKGKIWVESEPGKGSTFYFCISK